MTPRDVLREWAEHAETHIGPDCADSRALRELDQLLADTYKIIDDNGWHGDYMEPIYKRLAQAGYGEK